MGPGQLGNYIVKVSGNKIDEAKAQVKDSPITDSVQVLQEWPIDQ